MPMRSTSTSRSKPTERVMMWRNFDSLASSSLIMPALTCSAIHEWSSVICSTLPSRKWKARLSPTWHR